ncbi:hypothetical protein Misp06_02880 [Microbulbifer sp. NBRC 101763]
MGSFVVEALVVALFLLYPVWRIFKRAGLNPIYSLTLFIPVLGFLVAGAVLAASRWSVSTKTEEVQ